MDNLSSPVLVTPEYCLSKAEFHSAGLEILDTRPAKERSANGVPIPLGRNNARGMLVIKLFVRGDRSREHAQTREMTGGSTITEATKSSGNVQQMTIYGRDRVDTVQIFVSIVEQMSVAAQPNMVETLKAMYCGEKDTEYVPEPPSEEDIE